MIQKKNSIQILIIVILIITVVAFFLFQRSRQSSLKDKTISDTSKPQTVEQIQQNEKKDILTIDQVVIDYITTTYPTATDIKTTAEYLGLGYAIMNTTYTFNEEDITKKIYLKQNADSWIFLYESNDTISCITAKEISASDSVLTLNCK